MALSILDPKESHHDPCEDSRKVLLKGVLSAAKSVRNTLAAYSTFVEDELALLLEIADCPHGNGDAATATLRQFNLIAMKLKAHLAGDTDALAKLTPLLEAMGNLYLSYAVQGEALRTAIEISNLTANAKERFDEFTTELLKS